MAISQDDTVEAGPSERLVARVTQVLRPYAHRASDVLRWGLGVSFLLGGGYKMLEPAVYQAYLAPVIASVWPTAVVSLDTVFLLAGVFETAFGVLLLADRWTTAVAAVAVPWLAGTNANFVVAVAQGEPTVDLLSLYVALMMTAAAVALDAAREPATPPADSESDPSEAPASARP